MTTDPQQVITATDAGAKWTTFRSRLLPTSPPRKDVPNPQQGMADSAASIIANTVCSSPSTVPSLDGAAAAAAITAANNKGIPQVVSQVVRTVHTPPEPPVVTRTVEAMLTAPMAKLGLNSAPPAVAHPPLLPTEEKRNRLRTPPTEHDCRKLFVGGLPTDVSDHEFLEFFEQYGDVVDSIVIIDRLTKRSRGFGFVTFATEKYANALLSTVPGKSGYVVINGKQCEVKASTPKADEGPHKHALHGAPGLWRSNPPRHDHGGYSPRHPNHAPRPGPMKQTMQQQPYGGKQFIIDNEFNGDIDGRNFDEVHVHPPQMNTSYRPMNAYGRNLPSSHQPLYHHTYQNVYPTYSNNSAASVASTASVPPSWEASYPIAPNQGYAQYASNTMPGNGGYYESYGQQYPNQYGNSSMPPPAMMGQTGYANYGNYYAEGGAPFPSQGANASGDDNVEPYPQAHGDGVEYDHAGSADQYE